MRRVAAATACLLPVLLAAPAHAEGEVGLSPDGRHWADRLTRPLFDPTVRWVPGDVRTARFWVRNLAPERGTVTVDLERADRDALADSGHLHVAARAGGGPWSRLRDGDLDRLVDPEALASGRAVPVDVRVTLDASAPNSTMVLSSELDLRVTLREAPFTTAADGGPGVALPDAGTAVPPWLPPVAVGLLATGCWLVVRRRTPR